MARLSLALLALCAGVESFAFHAPRSFIASPAVRPGRHTISMAGFGGDSAGGKSVKKGGKKGGKAPKTKSADLKPKRQWDKYKALIKEGKPSVPVAVRIIGEAKWYDIGAVATASGEIEQALQMHKRLILEHGVRFHKQLAPSRSKLEIGFMKEEEFAPLGKVELKEPLPECGYEGTPDPMSGYYCVYAGKDVQNIGGGSKETPAPTGAADSRGVVT